MEWIAYTASALGAVMSLVALGKVIYEAGRQGERLNSITDRVNRNGKEIDLLRKRWDSWIAKRDS